MTWYTAPEAVALLNGFTRRPRVKAARSAEWSANYTGKRVDALDRLWFDSGEYGSTFHVLGALFGDPNGVWDRDPQWATIRSNIAATGGRAAIRALRQQTRITNNDQ